MSKRSKGGCTRIIPNKAKMCLLNHPDEIQKKKNGRTAIIHQEGRTQCNSEKKKSYRVSVGREKHYCQISGINLLAGRFFRATVTDQPVPIICVTARS